MVYVLSKNGQALMPTRRYAKVRILLKEKKATVVQSNPLTIQLAYDTEDQVQNTTLGIDSGYLNIGYSVISGRKELASGEVRLLKGMSERLKERAMYRNLRRSRLRYRKPRFDNRRRFEGWLAPSVQHKLDSHISFVDKLRKIVPIHNVIIEVAAFDIQKIKNPAISGEDYLNGEQSGFWNLREYILHRDNHACQNRHCTNKGKSQILEVHHVGFWNKDRSNRPGNLITLCVKCHTARNHKTSGFLHSWKPNVRSFKDAAFMSTVRWKLKNMLNGQHVYGYETKSKRISLGLEKTHYNDAFCIAGGALQSRAAPLIYEQIKRNSRSLEKFYDAKFIDVRTKEKVSGQELSSGRRTRNKNLNADNLRIYRGSRISSGKRTIREQRYFYQPNDTVKYLNRVFTVKGTHNKGTRVILKESGKSVRIMELSPHRFRKGIAIK